MTTTAEKKAITKKNVSGIYLFDSIRTQDVWLL